MRVLFAALGLPLDALGIPQEDAYLERYYALAGSRERMTTFHQVFAMFRAAVGSAGVASRGEAGNGFLPDAVRVGRRLSLAYATRGLGLITDQSDAVFTLKRPVTITYPDGGEQWNHCDPYAVYARHVLRLRALSPPDERVEVRIRGTAIHSAFEALAEQWDSLTPGAAAGGWLLRALPRLGLSVREATDMAQFWAPRMAGHAAILLHFMPQAAWDAVAALEVSPPPDAVLRVFMCWAGAGSKALLEARRAAGSGWPTPMLCWTIRSSPRRRPRKTPPWPK